ncbi:hypothetical protein U9M48_041512 [Paspalum notatum var. saurae]|uniref:Uncharacterized protein n=1 Tax=Paspalum notatum var. saurae TaxID=547442 RepID=A0AAQ3UTB3_PASNO
MVEHLFNDTFTVTRLDPDGKKFDRVTRIEAHSDQTYMQLDVATEVYPMRVNEKFNMVLVSTLNLDGTPDTGYYTQAGRKTLADQYDYVMHGKLYKISEDTSKDSSSAKVYAFSAMPRTCLFVTKLCWVHCIYLECHCHKSPSLLYLKVA